jgi:Potential Queuosine, Q, salvage protein family
MKGLRHYRNPPNKVEQDSKASSANTELYPPLILDGEMGILTDLLNNLSPAKGYQVDLEVIEHVSSEARKQKTGSAPFDWKDPDFWPPSSASDSEVSQYFAVGNALNFRYWQLDAGGALSYCEGKKGGIQCRGAKYMWRCLRTCTELGSYPIMDATYLSSLTLSEATRIFRDDNGNDPMPDIGGRVENLRDLGKVLNEKWDGKFFAVVTASQGSLDKFADLSAEFRAFDDPLCKLTMVNAILHQGRGRG